MGSRFMELNSQEFEFNAPQTTSVDILNKDAVLGAIENYDPDAVINFAAFTDVEGAESQKGDKEEICYAVNAKGAANVAQAVKTFNKYLIHISTDYVFDGTKQISPYTEDDKPNPVNWYGQTKLSGEQFVLSSGCAAAIVRISMPFSFFHEQKKDIARFFLGQLESGNRIKAIEGQRITPTLVDDISEALKNIILASSLGIYHVSSTDSVSPLEFAKNIAEVFKLDYSLIDSISFEDYVKNKKAKLLQYSWLNPTKFEREFGEGILHTVEEGLVIFKQSLRPERLKKEVDALGENQI